MRSVINKTFRYGNNDFALLLLRIAIAVFMLTHGVPKLARLFSGEPVEFASVFGMSESLSLVLAVFAEFLCSILILIGLGTRFATVPLIITMAVAGFHVHSGDPFSNREMALLYLVVFIFLLITGAGKFSLDHMIAKRSKQSG